MKRWQGLFVAVFVIAMLGIIGKMDMEDELIAQQHYTDMVCAGYYPDYKDLKPSCD